jgi:hypothetical protein
MAILAMAILAMAILAIIAIKKLIYKLCSLLLNYNIF